MRLLNGIDIKIDNQSIYQTKIKSLRQKISLVSQDTTLFDDTIKNNIAYANIDASDTEIKEAAKLSYCEEFINELPKKYLKWSNEQSELLEKSTGLDLRSWRYEDV